MNTYVPIFRDLNTCGGRKLRTDLDTHTHTQDNYSNPRCTHAHRGLTRLQIIMFNFIVYIHICYVCFYFILEHLFYVYNIVEWKTFVVSEPYVNVVSAKFCGCTYIIIGPEQSTKVCSRKFSFCTEMESFLPRKFSTIR